MLVRSVTEILTPSPQKIAEIKTHLEDLQRVRSALASLSASLESTIPLLEKQFSNVFMRENFARFSDDIFAIIFEFTGFSDLRSAIHISHVCRRFRAIALSNPRLWTFIRPREKYQLEDAIPIAQRSTAASCSIDYGTASTVPSYCIPVSGRRVELILVLTSFCCAN